MQFYNHKEGFVQARFVKTCSCRIPEYKATFPNGIKE